VTTYIPDPVAEKLHKLLGNAHLDTLQDEQYKQFSVFLSLIIRWNARTNLTAIRDEEGILERHFVESIACAQALPAGTKSLLDFGSGAGFPGIPIAICHPEIAVTLAESQGKKAAFLGEAVRSIALTAKVHAARAETLKSQFDCVALLAVDKMERATRIASRLVFPGGWLALMTTDHDRPAIEASIGNEFVWSPPVSLPGADCRVLALGKRPSSPTGSLPDENPGQVPEID
jgi:16S rRNA (guanine527-N7)-methyltransferase